MFRLNTSSSTFAEFMPDSDSFIERGHSPLAGLLILTIACVFGGLLTWAALAEVEQVVRASGRVEPAGMVKVINHPNGGRIAVVHVNDGEQVAAGAPLISFDPELIGAELDELLGRFQSLGAEAARLRAEAFGETLAFEDGLIEARPDLVEEQTLLLSERDLARASRAEMLERAVEGERGEVRAFAAELTRLRNSHQLLAEQVEAVRELAARGLYPRMRMVELERQLSDVSGEISKAQGRLGAARAALAEAESRRDGLEREWRSTVLGELAELNGERSQLGEALKRERTLMRNLVVRAPVAGIVQELAVSGAGQSVGSNQPLMKLVPTGGGLVVHAQVENRDIGSVQVGQAARVKVQAYDFLHYGALEGRIERIAADATADRVEGTLNYEVTVRTDHDRMWSEGEELPVVPGMAVEVDLLVGERTVLSYLTDRIFRLKETAFREG